MGLHFEHSWGDGVAVLRFFNEVSEDMRENPACSPAQLAALDLSSANYRKLYFDIPASVENVISSSKENFDSRVNCLEMETLQLFSFGRDYLRRKKISPDALMQLSFQVSCKFITYFSFE